MSYKTYKDMVPPKKKVVKISTDIKGEQHLAQLLKTHPIVVVDIWAKWCRPCIQIADAYEEFAGKFPHVLFCKDNIDTEYSVHKDKVTVIPTFFFYAFGKISRITGADFTEIEHHLVQLIQSHPPPPPGPRSHNTPHGPRGHNTPLDHRGPLKS